MDNQDETTGRSRRRLPPHRPSSHCGTGWIRVYSSRYDEVTPWCGKWLLYYPTAEVDGAWAKVARATFDDELGIEAKVADRANAEARGRQTRQPPLHVMCVYTRDCRDAGDVAGVLAALRRLGFDQRLTYKEDAATLTGVYGSGAGLYVAQPGSLEFTRRRRPVDPAGIPPADTT